VQGCSLQSVTIHPLSENDEAVPRVFRWLERMTRRCVCDIVTRLSGSGRLAAAAGQAKETEQLQYPFRVAASECAFFF
jgi:hypothetical protein